jgi:hypothetical protein
MPYWYIGLPVICVLFFLLAWADYAQKVNYYRRLRDQVRERKAGGGE